MQHRVGGRTRLEVGRELLGPSGVARQGERQDRGSALTSSLQQRKRLSPRDLVVASVSL